MADQEATTGSSAVSGRFALTHADRRLPTTIQVVGRALWAAGVLVVLLLPAMAVMTRLTSDTWWWPLTVLLPVLVAHAVLTRVRVPRPRLKRWGGRRYLQQLVRGADVRGQLPEDPVERTAAGVFACEQIEGVILIAATTVTASAALLLWPPVAAWFVLIGAFLGSTVAFALRAARGRRYLELYHRRQARTSEPPPW